ncbi:methylthioribose kinase [compost metagenome]
MNVHKSFCSTKLYLTHGDLHTGNILSDGTSFKLIDHRGDYPNHDIYFDLAYDSGKLLHDLHANYTMITNGNFYLDTSNTGIRFGVNQNKVRNTYRQLMNSYKNWCDNQPLFCQDPTWWPRTLLIEGCQLCGIVPFHYPYPERSVVLYASGIVLLNKWLIWRNGKTDINSLFFPIDEQGR